MEIDELTETLLLELRNSEDRQVSFASIDLLSGKTWFKNLVTPERWLTGVQAAYNGVLLVHNYQSEKSPEHKGLVAIDAFTGDTLWFNYNYGFDYLSSDGPLLYDTRIQPRKIFLADIKTGATIRNQASFAFNELPNKIMVPEIISKEELQQQFRGFDPFANMVHYHEYNNFRIVSLHALVDGKLTQMLYVMQGINKVYEDLLNTDIQKLQPEAFIMHQNRLVYIKNKCELKVLSL